MSQIYSAFPRRALAGTLQATGAVLLVRNALFLAARFGYQTVPDLFPNGPVLFQVDLNGYFAALLIHNEADSGHALLVFHGKLTPITSSASVQQKQIAAPRAAKPPDLRRRSLVQTGYTNRHEMPNISGRYRNAASTERRSVCANHASTSAVPARNMHRIRNFSSRLSSANDLSPNIGPSVRPLGEGSAENRPWKRLNWFNNSRDALSISRSKVCSL